MPLSKELFATARRVAGEAAEDPDAGSGSGPDLANPLNFMLWKFLRQMQEATRSGGAGGAVGADFSAGDNICVTFGHAVQSVRGCPWRVYDAQAAQELNGIGSWLAKVSSTWCGGKGYQAGQGRRARAVSWTVPFFEIVGWSIDGQI